MPLISFRTWYIPLLCTRPPCVPNGLGRNGNVPIPSSSLPVKPTYRYAYTVRYIFCWVLPTVLPSNRIYRYYMYVSTIFNVDELDVTVYKQQDKYNFVSIRTYCRVYVNKIRMRIVIKLTGWYILYILFWYSINITAEVMVVLEFTFRHFTMG